MKFIDIPTEQTTAVTDGLLALLALGCGLYLLWIGQDDPWKARLWAAAMGLLAVAAGLGTVIHGFKKSPSKNLLLWQPLNLALGLTVALFAVGVVYDLWGPAPARRVLLPLLAVGMAFFGVTRLLPRTFLIFTIYQTIVTLFALVVYGWLAFNGQLAGAGLMAAGVLVTIIAAAVQTNKAVLFTFIWKFNYNGAYHLIQMVGVVLLTAGLRTAF